MRKHKIKFALELNGVKVQTMSELRANFDFPKIIEFFHDGQLETWLRDRFFSDEADELKNLDDDKILPQRLCEILDVDYDLHAEELDDPDTVKWRRERRECLKEFTNDPEILRRVDDVAFDQDDLEDILREESVPAVIYLCAENFVFPSGILRMKNIRYVGVGAGVTVTIESKKKIDFDALKISFDNIKFNDDYTKKFLSKPAEKISAQTISDTQRLSSEEAKKIFLEGNDYYYGRNGRRKDPKRAFDLFKKAAAMGNTDSKNKLAFLFNLNFFRE